MRTINKQSKKRALMVMRITLHLLCAFVAMCIGNFLRFFLILMTNSI